MTRKIIVAVALLLGLAPAGARGEEPVTELFRRAVAAKGPEYVAARAALVARAGEARPVLEAAAASADWRERVTAAAVLGWIDHPALYAELEAWHPSPAASRLRNPMPASKAEALARLAEAGDAAIPFMLEQLSKRLGHMWGGPEARLVALRVPDALPVLGELLVESESYNGMDEIAGFGAAATPYLLAALDKAQGQRREIILYTMAETGDPALEPVLRRELRAGATPDLREVAARALGTLGAFATLRAELDGLVGEELREVAIAALGHDTSAEGRAFLLGVAKTARRGSDRSEAVQALLEHGTAVERAAVCALIPHEPSAEARTNMVEWLGSYDRDDPQVVPALLGALDDRAPAVREAAAYALRWMDDPRVRERALAMLRSTDAAAARLGFVMAENECGRDLGEASIRWLASPSTREAALKQLMTTPTPNATEPVSRLLSDPAMNVRFHAAVTLGYSDDPRAKAALEAASARERDPEVLRIIRESLEEWPDRSLCSTLEYLQEHPDQK